MTIRILSKSGCVVNRFRSVRKLNVVVFNDSIILEFDYFLDNNVRQGYKLKQDESFQVVQDV